VFAAAGSEALSGRDLLAHQIGAALTAGAVLLALAFAVVAGLIVRRPSVDDEPAPVPTDIARLTSR
jgi:hypothetical protein